jgi:hypothetical protein
MGFLNFNGNKGEVDSLLLNIRREYRALGDLYGSDFSDPLYNSFQLRYMHALNDKKLSLTLFLENELGTVKQIYMKKKNQTDEDNFQQKRQQDFQQKDMYGQYSEKFSKMIEHYPSVVYAEDMDEEISKLVGAVQFYEKRFWPECETILRRGFRVSHSDEISEINIAFGMFIQRVAEGVPHVLLKYIDELTSSFPSEKNLDRYKKHIIAEFISLAARVEHIMEEYLEVNMDFKDDLYAALDKSYQELTDMVRNFRLEDFVGARKRAIGS